MLHISDHIRLFKAISKIICSSDFNQVEFYKVLRVVLCHQARADYPDKSIAELSSMTGIPRGAFSEYLDEKIPQPKNNKLTTLLQVLWSNKGDDNIMPLHGDKSYFKLAPDVLNSCCSPTCALNDLIKFGGVELVDENQIKIISVALDVSTDQRQADRIQSSAIDRLVSSIAENRKIKKARYQNTLWSDKIPPSEQAKLHKELFDYLKNDVFVKLQGMFEAHEKDGCKTYKTYGISFFEFLDQ